MLLGCSHRFHMSISHSVCSHISQTRQQTQNCQLLWDVRIYHWTLWMFLPKDTAFVKGEAAGCQWHESSCYICITISIETNVCWNVPQEEWGRVGWGAFSHRAGRHSWVVARFTGVDVSHKQKLNGFTVKIEIRLCQPDYLAEMIALILCFCYLFPWQHGSSTSVYIIWGQQETAGNKERTTRHGGSCFLWSTLFGLFCLSPVEI